LSSAGPQLPVGDQRQRGALGDRPPEQAACGGAGQQREYRCGTGGFTEYGDAFRVTAEGRDVLPHPAQGGDLIPQAQVVVEPVPQRAEFEPPEHADPVGDVDDDHVAVGGQPGAVVEL
jgi:hypothetical protein